MSKTDNICWEVPVFLKRSFSRPEEGKKLYRVTQQGRVIALLVLIPSAGQETFWTQMKLLLPRGHHRRVSVELPGCPAPAGGSSGSTGLRGAYREKGLTMPTCTARIKGGMWESKVVI